MFLTVLISILVFAVLAGLLLFFKDKKKSGWLDFYARGKDSGFTFKEIELLHKLAIKSRLENPSSLFFSQSQLDNCIKALVKSMRLSGVEGDQGNQDFLSKLYDYRTKIEMNKPKIKHGISTSRQISEGQNLRILVEGVGVFRSQIVKSSHNNLAISRPISSKIPTAFSWYGQKLSVYFWRDEDAGYVFDSEVLDEVFSKGIASIKIAHADSLFRTQKRKSIRLKLNKPAYLYPITNEDDLHKLEINPGVKCFLKDLSDTGCAVTIGGKATEGLRVKIQFVLKNFPICMSGTVRSLEYKEEKHRSVLHIEADHLPIEIRNMILGEVFGMLPDDEEDLPFRLLDEEAESMNAEDAKAEGVENAEVLEEELESAGTAM